MLENYEKLVLPKYECNEYLEHNSYIEKKSL